MPTTCAVPGCDGADPGRYQFPKDSDLNRKWRIAIKRSQPWKPSEYSRVCGAHFKPDDFRETLASMYSSKPTVMFASWVRFRAYVHLQRNNPRRRPS